MEKREFNNKNIWCGTCKNYVGYPITIQLEFNPAMPENHRLVYCNQLEELTSFCSPCFMNKQNILEYSKNIERLKSINNLNRKETKYNNEMIKRYEEKVTALQWDLFQYEEED
jgi:hypothetical protein